MRKVQKAAGLGRAAGLAFLAGIGVGAAGVVVLLGWVAYGGAGAVASALLLGAFGAVVFVLAGEPVPRCARPHVTADGIPSQRRVHP